MSPSSPGLGANSGAGGLAIFCDFDGTFSQRDVGSTLAQEYLPQARADLQKRYAEGGLSAWEYAVELFDGFEFGPERLETFLAGIELDVGARGLLGWCEERGVAFRILSDGFDYNLERLQAIHGIRFAYAANHLVFDAGRWRISPGGLNPACGCGTGTCKRSIIEAYRRDHPGAFCVHIGDGAVSDLCGARVADRVFAKGSLEESLGAQGVACEHFDDLAGVRRALEDAFSGDPPPAEPGRRASGDFRS
ncbi:MAG: HAD-IB family phosphatase [Myxococcota bacterium]|jgi:2-hydroxy-3-keto-5-methylthiopentenyl-1-phosphate phosphatase|nr:HAD-IB family phosphatase [Myxococcota bacterium]